MTQSPLFTLVVATRGRCDELARLLENLCSQTLLDFDVIIVDQNTAPILDEILSRPWPFVIRHLRTPGDAGACKARNVGWRVAAGRWILFPDDDCWYPEGFLDHAVTQLESLSCDVLTGRAADLTGRSINGRFESAVARVRRSNVWTTSIEWVAIFRLEVLKGLGGFDEQIGIGAATPWQSCESQDILLRALEQGARIVYDPELFGHHAELETRRPDEGQMRKGRAYARGMGWVLRKHDAPWMERLYWVARPATRAALTFLLGRLQEAAYQREVAVGRLEGAWGRLLS